MLLEVSKSIDIAYQLCRIFTLYNVDMEVHADINTNPNFKNNDALKEAMAYIMGMSARMNHSDGGVRLKPNQMHLPVQVVQIKWCSSLNGDLCGLKRLHE